MKKFLHARRAEFIAGVLALLVALCFVPQVLHFAHRNDAEREVWRAFVGRTEIQLPFWQTLESFEYRLYDARIAARGVVMPKSLDKIAIVGVDENSLQEANWPFPRSMHARLVGKLKAAGARVVVLDFDFSKSTEDDQKLEDEMRRGGYILLPSYITPEAKDEKRKGESKNQQDNADETLTLVYRTTTPFEYFDEYTPDLALAYIPLDSDGRARRYPLSAKINDYSIGSLGALAAACYQGLIDGEENPKYEQALATRLWPALDGRAFKVPVVASRSEAAKSDGGTPTIFSTPIHFFGPPSTFDTYSYVDVLKGDDKEYSLQGLKEKFGGKIVFVGATTHILKDTFDIPTFAGQEIVETQIPGVEIHATATAMLLDGAYIRSMSTPQTLWLLFGLTFFSSLWAASLSTPVSKVARGAQVLWAQHHLPGQAHTVVWFGLYLLLSALPLWLFWWAANRAFQEYSLWVVVAYPALSAGIATACVLLLLFSVESGERRKIERYFTRLVSPELKAKMLASGQDYLEAEKVCVTVLFTDLEGFTTYSESHPPEEVIEITNDFLSSVVPVIYRHGGWVDKYIGDAIMAVFGTPVEYSDHAERALRVAIEMQDEAAAWRRRTGIGFYMRVGIHTGEVIAGNMGSRATAGIYERMDYTVIGDTVNLASRLEGKNKEFDSWIMCSAVTFDAAPDVVAAQEVRAPIKGKSQEVEVYIVRGLKDDSERDKNWAKDAI